MVKTQNRSAVFLPVIAAGLLISGMGAAPAQEASQEIVNRLNRLQNEITTLQRHVYQGRNPPVAGAPPAAAGPASMARQSVRITQVEDEIRRLTGVNETLNHRIRQLEERIDKMGADIDLRLKTLEGGGRAADAAAPSSGDAPSPPPAAPRAAGSPPVENADKGAKALGAITSSDAPAVQSATLVETPEQQYDRAHGLLMKQRDYAGAERVFSDFIARNPKHQLTPNAYYWLGRTFFVRKDFEQSVSAFATGFKNYPTSKKAPATLLNLGMSLSRLGKPREACETFTHLARHFPDAEGAVKRRMASERQTAKCR